MARLPVVLRSEYGRLGNQIFQYAALRQISGTLALAGFSDLFATFVDVDAKPLPKRLQRLLNKLSGLDRLPDFMGVVEENRDTGELRYKPGKRIYLCRREVFAQTGSLSVLQHGLNLTFRPNHVTRAREFLAAKDLLNRDYLIVHVRGGDYAYFPSREHPAQLPLDWVSRQISRLRAEQPDAELVIVGDDHALKNEVAWITGGIQSHEKPAVDLVLMAMSIGGVLSASSFAWWGAAFATHRLAGTRFIAPEHWFGHRLGRWEPPSVAQSPHLEFSPVWFAG